MKNKFGMSLNITGIIAGVILMHSGVFNSDVMSICAGIVFTVTNVWSVLIRIEEEME